MKKKNKQKRLLIILTIISLLLFGCGKTEIENTSVPQVEETTTIEETKADETEQIQEETTIEESKTDETEQVQETTVGEPETNDTQEHQDEIQDPGEVEYITDYLTVWEYMTTLDPSKLCIVIYNETEHYIIDMKEGQHYSLKNGDKVFTMFENCDCIGYGYDFDVVTAYLGAEDDQIKEMEIDYQKMKQNHKFFIKRKLESGEIIELNVYLDPPQ